MPPKITRNISMIIIPKKKKNNRPVWMCAKIIPLLCLQREIYVLWWWNSLKRDWVSTVRPCSKNNEPMPWARRWLLWERREAGSRWGRTSWHMSRGKLRAQLQLGMKVRERSVVLVGLCGKLCWGLSHVYNSWCYKHGCFKLCFKLNSQKWKKIIILLE